MSGPCVLVDLQRVSTKTLADARAACALLQLEPVSWSGGAVIPAPIAIISELHAGERKIPEPLLALLETTPPPTLVLCSQEALVAPRVPLAHGRVVLVEPPHERPILVSILRDAMRRGTGVAPPVPVGMAGHFEVRRQSHWIAWSRGASGPAISLDESGATTVVVGDSVDHAQIVALMQAAMPDAECERALAAAMPAGGVVQLSRDATEWLFYWARPDRPLWICSPQRLPGRWSAAECLAAGDTRMLRMAAFSGDQLVALWAAQPISTQWLGDQGPLELDSGVGTIATLTALTAQLPTASGLVVEVA